MNTVFVTEDLNKEEHCRQTHYGVEVGQDTAHPEGGNNVPLGHVPPRSSQNVLHPAPLLPDPAPALAPQGDGEDERRDEEHVPAPPDAGEVQTARNDVPDRRDGRREAVPEPEQVGDVVVDRHEKVESRHEEADGRVEHVVEARVRHRDPGVEAQEVEHEAEGDEEEQPYLDQGENGRVLQEVVDVDPVEVAGFDIRKLVNCLAVRSPHPHLPEYHHCFFPRNHKGIAERASRKRAELRSAWRKRRRGPNPNLLLPWKKQRTDRRTGLGSFFMLSRGSHPSSS